MSRFMDEARRRRAAVGGAGANCRADPTPPDPPTPEAPPWPKPPADEAYYGLAGRVVRLIEPASEADPAALLAQTLVAFGNAAGRSGCFHVEGDRHQANEYAVVVGRTSKGRKGTSWGRVLSLLKCADGPWASARVLTGLSSGEGLIWQVRDPIKKMERVKDGGAVRYKEAEADPSVADKRLLVYEPEFANVLKQTERQGNTLSAIVRVGWDGRDLASMTKNSPARATNAHVSLIGHITADELRRYLTATESANGFLFVCADRPKLLPEDGVVDESPAAALQAELAAALNFAGAVGEVRRDDQARGIWREAYEELSGGRPGLAGALLGRAEAHALRLSLIYALMDRSPLIRGEHLLAAMALWDYCERSVRYVFGDCLGDPVADELLRLLRGNKGGLTRTQLRDYFSRNADQGRVSRALGLLLQHGLARVEQVQTGGRPAETWYATGK
jgi:hypothetical protein